MRPQRSGAHAASNGRTNPEPPVLTEFEFVTRVLPLVDETAVVPADCATVFPCGPVPLLVTAVTVGKSRTSLAHLRTGCHEVLEELRDILVIDVQLLFERVEVGFVKHLPPFAL
jgi:hypothetical protein